MEDIGKILKQDEIEKKMIGRSVHNKHRARHGGCNFNFNTKEALLMNGEIYTVKFNKILTWKEILELPRPALKAHMEMVAKEYGVSVRKYAKTVEPEHFWAIEKLIYNSGYRSGNRRKKQTAEQVAAWEEFVKGNLVPAEIVKVDEEPIEVEVVESAEENREYHSAQTYGMVVTSAKFSLSGTYAPTKLAELLKDFEGRQVKISLKVDEIAL